MIETRNGKLSFSGVPAMFPADYTVVVRIFRNWMVNEKGLTESEANEVILGLTEKALENKESYPRLLCRMLSGGYDEIAEKALADMDEQCGKDWAERWSAE